VLLGLCGPLAAAPYSGGDGTSDSPYLLSTPADLVTLANTREDWGQWFILTTDLDLRSTLLPEPIGNRPAPFTGVFDGAGHSLTGLTINDTEVGSKPVGLFGVLGALSVVERLRLVAPSVQTVGNMHAGALAGETALDATVQQCCVEQGSVSTPSSDAAGGLIGDNGGTVRECYSTAAVSAFGLAGGLLGRSTGLVENCAAASAVTTLKAGTGTAAGGLAGADVGGTIRNCLALSTSITSARGGGLIGYSSPTTTVVNSVCNQVVPKAVENWPADVPGSAWREEPSNLADPTFFTGLGWDFQGVWHIDSRGVPGLRWMSDAPLAVIRGPSGTIQPDPKTGLAKVDLDGSRSTDPGGAALTYNWKCLTSSGEPTKITIDSVAGPTIYLPGGTWRIELTVSNGKAQSSPATLTITVAGGATVPTAVAKGPSGTVRPDPATGLATVVLDGSQSSDPDKKPLKYAWRCLTSTGGLTSIMIDPVVKPSVSLPAGAYRIELRVNNGAADSTPSVITITVNAAPTVVIEVPSGTIVPDPKTGLAKITLDGSQSRDPEGDPLRFSWRCLTPTGGSTGVTIEPVASPSVSLRAGTYRIELIVNDGLGDSAPFAVTLTVGGGNTPPTARITGPIGLVRTDPATGLAKISLDGSQSSDPDKDPLRYVWRCLTPTGLPTGITINAVVNPSVHLRAGTYRIELTVNDGKADSAPVFILVTVTFTGTANTAPTAVVKGPSGIVRPDPATGLARVALDGSQSSDPDKDPLKYTWKCLTASGGATGITIDPVANPSVHLRPGTYRIELTVHDGTVSSVPAVASVTVNTAPTARVAGPYEVLDQGMGRQQVQLDGSQSSDPEAGQSQTLVYSWTCATANPASASGPTPSLTFPVGTHTVQLLVSDGVESAQATTQVVVRSAWAGTRMAASPSMVGRTSGVKDVKFYLLLPAGKGVADVDPQAPIGLEMNGTQIPLTRDTSYNHKKYTVVAYAPRATVLSLAGTGNGTRSAQMIVRLKTGESVFGTMNLQIVAGDGPTLVLVLAERMYFYADTKTWR
jgi:hypothetical protein